MPKSIKDSEKIGFSGTTTDSTTDSEISKTEEYFNPDLGNWPEKPWVTESFDVYVENGQDITSNVSMPVGSGSHEKGFVRNSSINVTFYKHVTSTTELDEMKRKDFFQLVLKALRAERDRSNGYLSLSPGIEAGFTFEKIMDIYQSSWFEFDRGSYVFLTEDLTEDDMTRLKKLQEKYRFLSSPNITVNKEGQITFAVEGTPRGEGFNLTFTCNMSVSVKEYENIGQSVGYGYNTAWTGLDFGAGLYTKNSDNTGHIYTFGRNSPHYLVKKDGQLATLDQVKEFCRKMYEEPTGNILFSNEQIQELESIASGEVFERTMKAINQFNENSVSSLEEAQELAVEKLNQYVYINHKPECEPPISESEKYFNITNEDLGEDYDFKLSEPIKVAGDAVCKEEYLKRLNQKSELSSKVYKYGLGTISKMKAALEELSDHEKHRIRCLNFGSEKYKDYRCSFANAEEKRCPIWKSSATESESINLNKFAFKTLTETTNDLLRRARPEKIASGAGKKKFNDQIFDETWNRIEAKGIVEKLTYKPPSEQKMKNLVTPGGWLEHPCDRGLKCMIIDPQKNSLELVEDFRRDSWLYYFLNIFTTEEVDGHKAGIETRCVLEKDHVPPTIKERIINRETYPDLFE